ncbi:MAG: rRNA large subunit methyltransferase I, partial [Clostridia bacterium]|nr:rRNA large subunit methyltransferase I [Clostridia bacterium]
MKTTRIYPRIIISKKGTRWTEDGHPWIYEAEVRRIEDAGGNVLSEYPENGALVDVLSEGGKYLGTGFLSLKSKIRVRILSR